MRAEFMEDLLVTLAVLAGAVFLLVSKKLRQDLVAALIIVALCLGGVLSFTEATAGFASQAVIIVGSMFIIGEGILNTGIAQRFGEFILKRGGSGEAALMVMIMISAAIMGAFMSSTATAAIFIPIVMQVAEKASLNPRRLLIPLAAAALISGMMTLVATSANIVANNILREMGQESLHFFSFTPFGLLSLALAVLFMLFFGRSLLAPKGEGARQSKDPSIDDLLGHYSIARNEYLMRVPASSGLADKSVAQMRLASHHVTLLAVRGAQRRQPVPAGPELVFQAEDVILLIGSREAANLFAQNFGLEVLDRTRYKAMRQSFFQVVGVAEVMLTPNSPLNGKSLKEARFQSFFHCLVLGIRRKGESLTEDVGDIPLKFGDILLICGAWSEITRLNKQREHYLLLTLPQDYREFIPGRSRELVALFILLGMIAALVSGLLPPVGAIFTAATAMVLTGCVERKKIYQVIDWPTLLLIAGMLPLTLALQKSGAVGLIAQGFGATFATAGPFLILGGLFLLTSILGLVMNNTAVAMLLTPLAVDVALALHLDPRVCVLMVALACSAVFTSPLGSTVNMLVMEPGSYSFKDYLKTGLPLLLLIMAGVLFLAWALYF
ncbi:SLC13 family permease [Desulfovibrio sp. OttesenSCG-928-C14]|nr:SLC13 family permease [Desulfovibrio sp. OttesenSCG-928-C14]